MWIKTSQGLINSDKFGRFFVPLNPRDYGEGNEWLVVARPADIPFTGEEVMKYGKEYKSMKPNDTLSWVQIEREYDDTCDYDFDTVVETFKTRDDAKKYLDKLAEKLGAEVIDIE